MTTKRTKRQVKKRTTKKSVTEVDPPLTPNEIACVAHQADCTEYDVIRYLKGESTDSSLALDIRAALYQQGLLYRADLQRGCVPTGRVDGGGGHSKPPCIIDFGRVERAALPTGWAIGRNSSGNVVVLRFERGVPYNFNHQDSWRVYLTANLDGLYDQKVRELPESVRSAYHAECDRVRRETPDHVRVWKEVVRMAKDYVHDDIGPCGRFARAIIERDKRDQEKTDASK